MFSGTSIFQYVERGLFDGPSAYPLGLFGGTPPQPIIISAHLSLKPEAFGVLSIRQHSVTLEVTMPTGSVARAARGTASIGTRMVGSGVIDVDAWPAKNRPGKSGLY